MELIIPTVCGDQTTLEYSRIGRTYVMKALTSISLSRLRRQRRIWMARMCALATIRFMCATNVSLSHAGTVVPECFKDDNARQWKSGKFDPRSLKNPRTIENWPKICVFWGKLGQNVKFCFRDPQKAHPCAKRRHLTY